MDIEKLNKQIEKKANKEDIKDKFENWEVKVTLNDKANKNMQTTLQRLEVRYLKRFDLLLELYGKSGTSN